mgnify:CR=1 FL=1|tara:strand:- start:247 stop:1266 length:1020 start_codon:yes stop_codon:yes gene_type:complete
MPVPSSGQLRLRADIALEVDGSDTEDNVSLGTLSNSAGFAEPDAMSDFYGYVSYTTPTISGTPSTSNVYDTTMDINSPSYTNPDGGNVTRGFYIGTSTTATNNTFYSAGNSTATSGSFSRTHSTSGGTTYYIWAVIRDTESPARFNEVLSNMKTQTTQPAVSYSTETGSGVHRLRAIYEHSSNPNYGSSNVKQEYNHVYYGYTIVTNTTSGGGPYQSSGGEQQYTAPFRVKYRSGAATANRTTLTLTNVTADDDYSGPTITAKKLDYLESSVPNATANGYFDDDTATRSFSSYVPQEYSFSGNNYSLDRLDRDVTIILEGKDRYGANTAYVNLSYTYNV